MHFPLGFGFGFDGARPGLVCITATSFWWYLCVHNYFGFISKVREKSKMVPGCLTQPDFREVCFRYCIKLSREPSQEFWVSKIVRGGSVVVVPLFPCFVLREERASLLSGCFPWTPFEGVLCRSVSSILVPRRA